MSRRDQIKMSPEEIDAFVAERRTLMVASVAADGAPHLVPMWFALVDGEIVFWTYRSSQKIVNLRRDPRLTCLLEAGETYQELRGVSMQGTATITEDPSAVRRAGEAILARYAGPLDDATRAGVSAHAAGCGVEGSFALEVGAALGGEGSGAFAGVPGGEDCCAQAGVDLEGVVLGHALGLAHGPQDRLYGERPVRRDQLGQLERAVQRRTVRHHVADQTVRQRFASGDVPAGKQQVRRHRVRDLAG